MGLASAAAFTGCQNMVQRAPLRSERAVNSTMNMGRSIVSEDRPGSRRLVNAASNSSGGIRTGLMSKLENPNPVKRSAGDQPCARI